MTARTGRGTGARGTSRKPGAAAWLHLAATPTFAAMALLSATMPATGIDMMCPPRHGAAALGGMAAMYLLMGTLHAAAWVELIAERRRRNHSIGGRGRGQPTMNRATLP